MAVTYATYDASTPVGGLLAQAADHLRQGYDQISRAYDAMNAATNAGATKDNLIDGDFGAIDSANATRLWDAVSTIKTLLDGDLAGGLLTLGIGSIDKGISG